MEKLDARLLNIDSAYTKYASAITNYDAFPVHDADGGETEKISFIELKKAVKQDLVVKDITDISMHIPKFAKTLGNESINFNSSIDTVSGFYKQPSSAYATIANGYPVDNSAGSLLVMGARYTTQLYVCNAGLFTRDNDTFITSWKQHYDSQNNTIVNVFTDNSEKKIASAKTVKLLNDRLVPYEKFGAGGTRLLRIQSNRVDLDSNIRAGQSNTYVDLFNFYRYNTTQTGNPMLITIGSKTFTCISKTTKPFNITFNIKIEAQDLDSYTTTSKTLKFNSIDDTQEFTLPESYIVVPDNFYGKQIYVKLEYTIEDINQNLGSDTICNIKGTYGITYQNQAYAIVNFNEVKLGS